MKPSFIHSLLLLLAMVFLSCNKTNNDPRPIPPEPTGTVELLFTPMFGEDSLVFNKVFTSPAGEKLLINNLKFFLSEIGFAKSDNREENPVSDTSSQQVFFADFTKVNAVAASGNTFQTSFRIRAGDYRSLRFNIGVPRKLNMADPTTAAAPLNIAQKGMYWSWKSGYIFLLMEGKLPEMGDQSFHFGIGEDKRTMPFAFGDIFSPNTLVSVLLNKTTRIQLRFDVQKTLSNGDGTFYSFAPEGNASVHGGNNANILRVNATNAMDFVSSVVLP